MDAFTIYALILNAAGWGLSIHFADRAKQYRAAWKAQCLQSDKSSHAEEMAECKAVTYLKAARAAGDELRAARKSNDALAAKCADLTKQLIATREALEESDKFCREASELTAARWKQIEELQAQLSGVSK